MSHQEIMLAELVASFAAVRIREIPSLRTVLKTVVFPHLRVPVENFDDRLARVAAHRLYALFTPDGTRWCDELGAALPIGMTYQKAYFRAVKRLVVHGEAAGLLHPDQFFITPTWRALIAEVARLTVNEAPARRSAQRGAFKRLARWATAQGFEPAALPVDGGDRPLAGFHLTFPATRDGDYFRARTVWNTLVADEAMPGLRFWGAILRGQRAARPRHAWPPILERSIAMLFAQDGLGGWRETTRSGYRQRISSYLGVLGELGVDVDAFLALIDDPSDAVRLLFQGVPAGTPRLDARQFADRLATDEPFRTKLLTVMVGLTGSFDGRASEANPFVVATVAKLVDAGTITTGSDLVNKAMAINRGMLDLADRHNNWLTKIRKRLRDLAVRSPSAYTEKKRAIFRHPTLWAELVRARPRLRSHTLMLESAWLMASGGARVQHQRRWAVALRNEALFGLLLCYPLRVANLTGMRLGANFKPARHEIFFTATETKNDKEIDFELPAGGALGDVRALMAQYLLEARPVLLAGRTSDHVFVPDPRGGTRLREKAVNAILVEMSRQFLTDILPPGVTALNPHLVRHTLATYALAVCQNLNLAAQLLNDAPSTITQAYADVLACKRETTKAFLSGFTI